MKCNSLIARDYDNKIVIQFNDENYDCYNIEDTILTKVIKFYDISPYDFYRILDKYVKRIEKTTLYEFDSYEVAEKAVDEIESYLVMNKLTGE